MLRCPTVHHPGYWFLNISTYCIQRDLRCVKHLVTFQPLATSENLPTHIGALKDLALQEDLPNAEDIHYWTHGNDNEDDNATVHRMLDLLEDAEELENAEDTKRQLHLYRGVMELLDN